MTILSIPNSPKDPKATGKPPVRVKRGRRTQLIGVFGLPLVGKDSFIEAILNSKPQAKIAYISSGAIVAKLLTPETKAQMQQGGLYPLEEPLRAEVKRQVEKSYDLGAGLVLIAGFPRMGDQVLWLLENFSERNPSFLQLKVHQWGEIRLRAAKRGRDEFDSDPIKLTSRLMKQSHLIDDVERVIWRHACQYYSIINDDLQRAVKEFWLRFQV